jgi:AAA domain
MLNSNGMSFDLFTTPGMGCVIQGTVLDVQLALEEGVKRVLKARGRPAVVLCDRGAMDGSVYVTADEFRRVLADRNTDVVQLRDNRYDACFHMVSAADGAEPHYTLENNKVRTESVEDARMMDQRTQRAWLGHPHLYVVDNSTDFEGKMSRLVDIIAKIVGLPSNLKRRSAKFLLSYPPDFTKFPVDIDYQVFEVEKVYLRQFGRSSPSNEDDNNYSFIRRRSSVDRETGKVLGSVYQITTVQQARNSSETIEQKRIITRREYDTAYQTSRDPQRHIVLQRRVSFLYEKQSFVIHMYKAPVRTINILHAQVEANKNNDDGPDEAKKDVKDLVRLPPFLHVDRPLRSCREDEEMFGAYSISLKN